VWAEATELGLCEARAVEGMRARVEREEFSQGYYIALWKQRIGLAKHALYGGDPALNRLPSETEPTLLLPAGVPMRMAQDLLQVSMGRCAGRRLYLPQLSITRNYAIQSMLCSVKTVAE